MTFPCPLEAKADVCNKRNMPLDKPLSNPHYEDMKSFLNASELAKLVGVDRATIARWIKKGVIKGAVKRPGSQHWMIPMAACATLIRQP